MLLKDKSIDAVTHAKPLALTDCILGVPGGQGHLYRQALLTSAGRVGRTVHFDPQAEQVIGDDEANLLLRDGDRGYRPPFVVPENV